MYSLVYSLVYSFLREMYTLYTLSINTLFLLNKENTIISSNIEDYTDLHAYTHRASIQSIQQQIATIHQTIHKVFTKPFIFGGFD